MLKIFHVTAGARDRMRLVQDDTDRFVLLRRIAASFGDSILAWCFMDTHLHLVLEGERDPLEDQFMRLLRAYGGAYLRKHRLGGPLLRGRPVLLPIASERELARTIHYVHDNPVEVVDDITRQLEYEWSSAREYGGLSLLQITNVARVELVLDDQIALVRPRRVHLFGLECLHAPLVPLEVILAASSQVLGLTTDEVRGDGRSIAIRRARAIFMALAKVELRGVSEAAAFLGVSRQQAWNSTHVAVTDHDVRVARTVARNKLTRARLRLPESLPLPV
jgi:REP element-mobilizing transposase RayT